MPPEDSPRPRKWKPLLLKLGVFVLLFLAAGAMATLAVAWSATWWRGSQYGIRDFKVIELHQVNGRPSSAGPAVAEVATNRLTTRVTVWSRLPEGSSSFYDVHTPAPGSEPWWVPDVLWCDSTKLDSATFRSGDRVAATVWEAAGWPWRAVRCASGNMYTADGKGWMIGGERGRWMLWKNTQPVALPLEPAWPGFAINTIFYAAMLWLLWIAPRNVGKIRRFIRVSRGRCPACGFIIAPGTAAASGGPCSECGAASPASMRPTSD